MPVNCWARVSWISRASRVRSSSTAWSVSACTGRYMRRESSVVAMNASTTSRTSTGSTVTGKSRWTLSLTPSVRELRLGSSTLDGHRVGDDPVRAVDGRREDVVARPCSRVAVTGAAGSCRSTSMLRERARAWLGSNGERPNPSALFGKSVSACGGRVDQLPRRAHDSGSTYRGRHDAERGEISCAADAERSTPTLVWPPSARTTRSRRICAVLEQSVRIGPERAVVIAPGFTRCDPRVRLLWS